MLLMISVLSADEAKEAILGGAEILDIKNPAEGSLGAQPPGVIQKIKRLASNRLQISAAIGDMPNLPGTAALAAFGAAVSGADYIKVGLLGPQSKADAAKLLWEVKQAVLEFQVAVVAGGYADFRRVGAMNPVYLPDLAAQAGIQGCLIDTAIKDGRTLFDFLGTGDLKEMAKEAHHAGLLFGLAGALREQDLLLVRSLGADIAGIRTAACQNNQRNGLISADRVRSLLRLTTASPGQGADLVSLPME